MSGIDCILHSYSLSITSCPFFFTITSSSLPLYAIFPSIHISPIVSHTQRDLRQELIHQKEKLHEEMIDELHRHLYVKASARKTTLREQQLQSTIASSGTASTDTQGPSSSPTPPRRQTGGIWYTCTQTCLMLQWNTFSFIVYILCIY